MSFVSQIGSAASSFVNFNQWAWSPNKNSVSDLGSSIADGIESVEKLVVRTITVGTAGAVAAFGAYKLGLLGATVTASTAIGFGFVATLGLVGAGALLYSISKAFNRM